MNEEWRIAAECAVQSGGNPVGFAGCTAVGERLLIDGARGLKIGFLAHVFDDIDRLLLRLSVRAAISRSACFLPRSGT